MPNSPADGPRKSVHYGSTASAEPDVESLALTPGLDVRSSYASTDSHSSIDSLHCESVSQRAYVCWLSLDLRHSGRATTVTSVLLVAGVFFGVFVEGHTVLNSVYLVMQTVSTIGYGDVKINNDYGKLFFAIYALVMLPIVAYALTKVIDGVVGGKVDEMRGKIHKAFRKIPGTASKRSTLLINSISRQQPNLKAQTVTDMALVEKPIVELKENFVYLVLALLFGTLFYRLYEHCSCSHGDMRVEGCKETSFEVCAATGGFTLNLIESFYMSVITLTTIGFGDHAPRTRVGRAVACVWCPLGILATFRFVECLCKLFYQYSANFEKANKFKQLKRMDSGAVDMLDRMRKDTNGSISRAEFICFMLVETEAVDPDLLSDLNKLFDSLPHNDCDIVTKSNVGQISLARFSADSNDVEDPN